MTIASKDEFRALSARGLLGNRFRTWETPEEVWGYDGWLTARARVKASGKFLPVVWGPELCLALKIAGIAPREVYFEEIPDPGTGRRLNIELSRSHEYWWLTHGKPGLDLNVRHDLEQNGRLLTGQVADLFLKRHLRPESMEMLQGIFDAYPDAIVEATEWCQPVGIFQQHMNIWEVRDY